MNVLGIFAKHPQPGRVKTRLAAVVGADAAAELYAAFVADLLDRFHTTADRRMVGYTPADAAAHAYFLAAGRNNYDLWSQPVGDLGVRIAAFFEHAFAIVADRVVLIGSDSPTLPAEFVLNAFAELEQHDCTLGPATDGGYYLFGLRQPRAELFVGIDWSGPDVLRQTVARIAASNLSLAVLPVWYDVDDATDLQFLRGHLTALQLAGERNVPPRTAALLSPEIPPGGTIR